MPVPKIEEVYVVCSGTEWVKRVHVVSKDSQWVVLPSLCGKSWSFCTAKEVIKRDFEIRSGWILLIPNLKGCLATCLRFSNGDIILL